MDFCQRKLEQGGKLVLIRFPNGNTYSCRHLTYKEYLTFRTLYDSANIPTTRVDELVATTVVQDPIFQDKAWLNNEYAGLCRTIANLVMYMGGNHYDYNNYQTFEQMLNAARYEALTIDNVMFSIICRAFPAYKFADLIELTYAEIIRLFANAERYLVDSGMLKQPIDFTGQSQPEKRKETGGPPINAEGKMVISEAEMIASEAFHAADDIDVVEHDKAIARMIEKRKEEQHKTDFASPEGQRVIQERNRQIAAQMRREKESKRGSFSTRKR